MIWDFKRQLYCAAQRVPVSSCQHLGDAVLRERLQRHFDSVGGFPPIGDNEYAVYFETVYRDEADRRRYIDQRIADATASYGDHGLPALLAMGRIKIIWSTNFDRVPEDAAAAALGGTGRLVVADLDRAAIAREALDESKAATGRVNGCITHEHLGAELGAAAQSIRVARLDPDHPNHRKPPAGWTAALARLARKRAEELLQLAQELEAGE